MSPPGPALSGDEQFVTLGVITGVIGIRGDLRVKVFTESPEALGEYGPLMLGPGGEARRVKSVAAVKGGARLHLEGVETREAAEALKGTELCVARAALGEPEDEETYYHVDLIGLRVEDEAGAVLGRVRAVFDFGAGDVLDIDFEDRSVKDMVPFTKEAVPQVDLAGGRMVVRMPDVLEADEDEGETE
ncbi:MAG: ribosome maturation factor RimM [Alphaproteobacteria bacterium]|nr:ribosome maturation factor RimM [Alphaproteobacteria bacterium]